jgi:hypothetical protein
MARRRRSVWLAVIAITTAALAEIVLPAGASSASTMTCGVSGGHTICVTLPDGPLTGHTTVGVTKSPQGGGVIFHWIPTGGTMDRLIYMFGPNPQRNYSFTWPTHKYLDGTGILRVQYRLTGAPFDIPVELANGNTTDFQHEPSDWESFLPTQWTEATDPLVAAVGDGPDSRPISIGVIDSIVARNPHLFLYLGDVYDEGTFAEFHNHYGVSSLNGSAGTMWGRLAHKTQPTVGNHEFVHFSAYQDYWHGRPAFTSFRFGGVLFLNLNSNQSMAATSAQYAFAQSQLATAPACVVAYWHQPTIVGNKIINGNKAMWQLLANNGGDLVVNGHIHSMMESAPLTGTFQLGGHLIQLQSGAGGHDTAAAKADSSGRTAWSLGKTPGAMYLSLLGAAGGGTATGIGWRFEKTDGTVVRTGAQSC